jgi:ATP-dependent protease HslVU (ClpYQ) peptidase subunit
MTCIIGLVDGKNVWLGGDRAATGGNLGRTLIKHPKIFTKSGIGIGVSGSSKVMDAIQHAIEFPKHEEGVATKTFLVNDLIPAFREGLKKLDCLVEHHGQWYFHGALLIGYRGELHMVEGNFQLIESAREFDAIGSGAEPALGSLRATRNEGPKKRILEALKVSAENNAGVAPPFDTLMVKG